MTSVHACAAAPKDVIAPAASRLSVAIQRIASPMAPDVSRSCLAAVVTIPTPSGLVRTRASPGLPPAFDTMISRGIFSEWRERGVRRADGKPFPTSGDGILFFPAGVNGPAFIVTENYAVLKEYNNSDAYAIAVGHLADRLAGSGPIRAAWPTDDRPLPRDLRIALQKKLASLGYKVTDFEGHLDFDLRDNIRSEQKKLSMVPDGNPTPLLLSKLGITVR